MATTKKKVLVLGMVYSLETRPLRGQEFRDRVRCEALDRDYDVYSLDNKHSAEKAKESRHCEASFTSPRLIDSIRERWGAHIKFDFIILDYFFSPIGWARERWSDYLFKYALPSLAREGILAKGGQIWLPYLDCVKESILAFDRELSAHFSTKLVADAKENPLYLASDRPEVEEELLKCPDMLTNKTQVLPLHKYSETPFCLLENDITPQDRNLLTPAKRRVSAGSRTPSSVVDASAILDFEDAIRGATPSKRLRTV